MTGRTVAALITTLALSACKSGEAPAPGPETTTQASAAAEVEAAAAAEMAEDEGSGVGVPFEIRIGADPTFGGRGTRVAPGRAPSQLYARVVDAEFNVLDAPVVWHSLDPERVDVDALGRLSALGPLGPAFVTASTGNLLAEPLPIYVVPPGQLPQQADAEGSGDEDGAGLAQGSGQQPSEGSSDDTAEESDGT